MLQSGPLPPKWIARSGNQLSTSSACATTSVIRVGVPTPVHHGLPYHCNRANIGTIATMWSGTMRATRAT